ncbi:unnamed protein product [Tetraodon nigroviridis]|uniref:(spotted green pufferfish) hypothetical protein n=1 Tax=Tetraodon nigroviridis TaxID=99883 RepID=Q4TII8_TETNG|nr:unnamed protein product [Tetraodon nigroviridis]
MTCRDRTLEFQSACKSLQGRPVRWPRPIAANHKENYIYSDNKPMCP